MDNIVDNIKNKFSELAKLINEKYKKHGIDKAIIFVAGEHPERLKPSFISTGHPEWDKPLCGGIPKGAVTTIHGSPWAGKTSFCLGVAANLLRQGKYVLYVNLEGIKLDAYSHIIGEEGDPMRNTFVEMGPGLTAEHTIDDIEKLVYDKDTKSPQLIFDLVIIDSANNLHTDAKEKAWQEGVDKVPQMGSRAKLLDDFLTRLYGKGMMGDNGTAIMIIAQDRANIAGASMPMAAKTTMSAGESIKYNSKLILKMNRKINLAKTGQTVTMVIEKNTVTGMLGEGEISIIYGQGKDDTQALVEKAKEFGYLVSGATKTSNILILPGLGDLELSAIKADKASGKKGVSLPTVISETIRSNPEIAHCLRITLSAKKPTMGVRQGYAYQLVTKAETEETTEE